MSPVKAFRVLVLIALADCIGLAALAAETSVNQSNQKFSVSSLALAAGDVVVFKNSDDVTHNINITPDGGDPDDQGLQKPGETIHYTFKTAGEYVVRCSIHPRMRISVTVQ